MAVIGTIYAKPSPEQVADMPCPSFAFMALEEWWVSKNKLAFSTTAPVDYLEEELSIEEYLEKYPDSVLIRRNGPGLTEDDFQVDFSHIDTEKFTLVTDTCFQNMVENEKKQYVIFRKGVRVCVKGRTEAPVNDEEETTQSLEDQINKAIESGNTEELVRLIKNISDEGHLITPHTTQTN